MATNLPWQFQLNPRALDLMADAMGREPHILRKDGRPQQFVLLGSELNNSTGSNIAAGRSKPSMEAVATIAKRYADLANVPLPEALFTMFDIVPADHLELCEAA